MVDCDQFQIYPTEANKISSNRYLNGTKHYYKKSFQYNKIKQMKRQRSTRISSLINKRNKI